MRFLAELLAGVGCLTIGYGLFRISPGLVYVLVGVVILVVSLYLEDKYPRKRGKSKVLSVTSGNIGKRDC